MISSSINMGVGALCYCQYYVDVKDIAIMIIMIIMIIIIIHIHLNLLFWAMM